MPSTNRTSSGSMDSISKKILKMIDGPGLLTNVEHTTPNPSTYRTYGSNSKKIQQE